MEGKKSWKFQWTRLICLVWLLYFNLGARAETGARTRGNQGYETEGVQGLKALGVRDLSYRMAYLACTVTPCNRKVNNLPFHKTNHNAINFYRIARRNRNIIQCLLKNVQTSDLKVNLQVQIWKIRYCLQLGRYFLNVMIILTGLPRVREKSGKNKIFSRSGNCQGILKKCQGILSIWPMSGNCQGILSWQLIFF